MSSIDNNELVEIIKKSERKDLAFRLLETCFKLEILVPDMAQLLEVSPLTIIQWFKNKKIPVSHEEEVLKFLKVLSFKEESKSKNNANKKNSLSVNKKIITYENGDKYEGDFLDGKRNGKGIYTWPNGDKYEGDWVDGKRTVKGTFTSSDDVKKASLSQYKQKVMFAERNTQKKYTEDFTEIIPKEESFKEINFEEEFFPKDIANNIPVADRGELSTLLDFREYLKDVSLDDLEDMENILKMNDLLDDYLR